MVGAYDGKPVMWGAAPADKQALAVWIPFEGTRDRLRDIDTAILASSLLAAGVVALAASSSPTGSADGSRRPPPWPAGSAPAISTPGSASPPARTIHARAAAPGTVTRYGTWRRHWI